MPKEGSTENSYKQLLISIKQQVQAAQVKAALAVNSSLIQLYWNMGKMIADNQALFEGRNNYVEQLAKDLRAEFPEMKGFSRSNLFYIRKFYQFYSTTSVQQLVGLNEMLPDTLSVQQPVAPESRQYPIQVGNKDYRLDLLFYHIRLRCFVVIDLKMVEFEPEVAGKMNFYLSAEDEQLKSAEDNPSIGIILCKNKNKLEVEYALRGLSKPIGVSEFSLTKALPTEFRSTLPTVEEFENELKQDQI